METIKLMLFSSFNYLITSIVLVKALNSWGQFPPPGLISGTTTSFGSYDQCLNIITPNSSFTGQYCTVLFRPLLPHRPRYHNILKKLSLFESIPRSSARNHVILIEIILLDSSRLRNLIFFLFS